MSKTDTTATTIAMSPSNRCRFCGARFNVALEAHEANCEWRNWIEDKATGDWYPPDKKWPQDMIEGEVPNE
jgi:hypothetical protein